MVKKLQKRWDFPVAVLILRAHSNLLILRTSFLEPNKGDPISSTSGPTRTSMGIGNIIEISAEVVSVATRATLEMYIEKAPSRLRQLFLVSQSLKAATNTREQ